MNPLTHQSPVLSLHWVIMHLPRLCLVWSRLQSMHMHDHTCMSMRAQHTYYLPIQRKSIKRSRKGPKSHSKGIHIYMYCRLACIIGGWFTSTTTDIILGLLDYSEEYIQYNHHLSASAGGCKNGCPCSKPGNKFSQRCIISEKSKKKIERIELLPKSRSAGIVEFWPFGHMCSCRLHRQFRVEQERFSSLKAGE